MGKFEIKRRKNQDFQYNLKARNGEVILTSGKGYDTKEHCLHAVDEVKENSLIDERFEKLVSSNGKPYFNLKNATDHIIGTSEMYENEASRDNGIESVKKNAPTAEIIDIKEGNEPETVGETLKDKASADITTAESSAPETKEKKPIAQPTKSILPEKKYSGWWKLFMLIITLLLLFWLWKSCYHKAEDTSETPPTDTIHTIIESTIVEEITPAVEKIATELTLPNGIKLNAFKGGIEDKLIAFLSSDEYKNAKEEDLKGKWFDFDNIDFEFGSGTKLEEKSHAQLNNIVEILKSFKDAKIKIGAYTDKVGKEEANLKLSTERAQTIKSVFEKAGLATQVVGAEGYGSKFAKYAADAPDSERALDRHISLRLTK